MSCQRTYILKTICFEKTYPVLLALLVRPVNARISESSSKEACRDQLKIVLAHLSVTTISSQALQAFVCSLLTRVKILAVAFTVFKSEGSPQREVIVPLAC